MSNIIAALEQFGSISDETKRALKGVIVEKKFKANELILMEGNLCKHLYFIESGIVKGFYTRNGQEITNWFAVKTMCLPLCLLFLHQNLVTSL